MIDTKNKTIYKAAMAAIFVAFIFIFALVSYGDFADAARKTKKDKTINLGFERTGRVAKIYVKVGDKVTVGQSLIELDRSDLIARLHQAEATLQVQKLKLNELKTAKQDGSSLALDSAKIALDGAKEDLVYSLEDAWTKADDAVRDKAGQVFINQRGSNPTPAFAVYDSSLQSSLASRRVSIESVLNSWQDSLDNLTTSSDLSGYINAAKANLNLVRSFLDVVALAVNLVSSEPNITQTTLRNWRSDIFEGRKNINAALKDISLSQRKLKDAQIKVLSEQQKLSSSTKTDSPSEITLQEGRVKEAQAQVEVIKTALSKMILRSPIKGNVKILTAKPGMIISNSSTVISIAP